MTLAEAKISSDMTATDAKFDAVRRSLPDGYDDETRVAEFNGHIVVAHPAHQPCLFENGKLVPIEIVGWQ